MEDQVTSDDPDVPDVPDVPDDVAERIIEIIKTGYTVTAVKELRRETGLGLRDALFWVDLRCSLLYGGKIESSEPPA